MSRVLMSSVFSVLVFGCTGRIADYTILSTKNIDLSRLDEYERTAERVKGSDARAIIIVIPTGTPSFGEAADNALESVPGGVALLDGVIDYSFFYIPYLFGQLKYTVEGTALVDPKLAEKHKAEPAEKTSAKSNPNNEKPSQRTGRWGGPQLRR
jgi:hypothetical protein